MSTIDAYFQALLILSGNEQLTGSRRALLQSMNSNDLQELVIKCTEGRKFERDGLMDIILILLDVIAKNPNPSADNNASGDQEGKLDRNNLLWLN
jgi:hypothetical protein